MIHKPSILLKALWTDHITLDFIFYCGELIINYYGTATCRWLIHFEWIFMVCMWLCVQTVVILTWPTHWCSWEGPQKVVGVRSAAAMAPSTGHQGHRRHQNLALTMTGAFCASNLGFLKMFFHYLLCRTSFAVILRSV